MVFMRDLAPSLRESLAIIAGQCIERLQKITQGHPENADTYAAMARGLFEAMAESMETRDPGRFLSSIDAHKDAITECSGDLPDMIAVMEELVLEWQFDAEETRFLWALFRQARLKSVSTAQETPETAGQKPTETFQALKKEIAERKQVEKRLRESERRFRDIAEFTPQVIFEMDAGYTVTFANKQAYEIYGYSPADFKAGISAVDLIHPGDLPRVRKVLEEIARGKSSTGTEYTAIRKDGSLFPVIAHVARIMKGLTFTGWRGIIVDITQRKKAEEKLRESKRKFRDIAELSPQIIFEQNADGMVTFANKRGLELFGYTAEDLQKGNIKATDLLPESERDTLRENLIKIIAGEKHATGHEYTVQRKDGTAFPAIIYTTAFFRNDRLAGFRGVLLDITQLRNADTELREREKRFRDLAEFMPQVIFEMDEKGTITFANKQAFEIFDYDEQDLLEGIEYLSLFGTEEIPILKTNLRKIAEGRQSAGNEYNAVRKDGTTFPVIIHVARIMKEGHLAGFRGMIVDITERKKAEESLRKSEERFRRYFEVPLIGVCIVAPEGQWLEVNDKFCDMVGFSREELLRMRWHDLTPAEDLPSELKAYRSFLKDIHTFVSTREKRYRRKDGGIIDVIISTHCVLNENGSPDYLMCVLQDITERKKAEHQIIESEQSLRAILAASPIGIGRVRDRVFEWVNEAMCDITGYTVDELTGRHSRILYQDDGAYERIGEELYRDGQVGTKWVKKDGEVRDILLQVSPADSHAYIYTASDITRLKLAENALKFTQFSVDRAGDSVYWIDSLGRIAYANDSACLSTGYDRQELLSMTIQEIGADYTASGWSQFWRGIVEKGSGQFESTHRKKDGTVFPVEASLSCLSYNEFEYICAFIRDITEHKKTEERLRLDESRTEALLKINQMANRPLAEITDFTLEESIRLTGSTLGYLAFLNEDESVLTMHSWSRKAMEDCMIGNKPIDYPLETTGIWGDSVRRRRPVITNDYDAPDVSRRGYPEGHVKVKRHLGVPVFDGEKIVAVVGVGNKEEGYTETDINQVTLMAQGMVRLLKQKTAQEALSISEARLRAILDSAKDTIFIKDKGLRYVVVNRAMSELFGIPVEKIVGGSDRDLFPPNMAGHIGQIDSRVLHGETIEEELARPIRDMDRIFHTIKAPLRNGAGEIAGLCGIARDVTERKHLESQLLQSQKMEAVGTLAGGVAHDFNNLLSAIMGYASLLQMKMDKDNPLFAYASHILTSSEKAAALTRSLLAFSRKQVINLRPVAINDTIEKVHRLLERLIPEDVEFRIERSSERLIALADPGQLDQVIMNLVTNARDAMPRGGKLTIATERVTVGSDFIASQGYGKPGEYAVIIISDTGIGMDRKILEKIFEPFFTTKGVGRGTGLGLAIVYGIVNQHNGYIDVRSRPGEGSVFSVYLPLVWLEPADEEAPARISGGTETILIAEDNADLCKLSVSVLEDHGYTVLAATDGSMAVETFREHKGAISLVILDVVMPKMNGKEVFDAIRTLDPSIKVIYTSGYTDDILEEKGVANKKYDFLGKPITPATLLTKIREVLDRP